LTDAEKKWVFVVYLRFRARDPDALAKIFVSPSPIPEGERKER